MRCAVAIASPSSSCRRSAGPASPWSTSCRRRSGGGEVSDTAVGSTLPRAPSRQGGSRMQRLTGLDAVFLYLETPTIHSHVASTAVFDPSTVPDGYQFDKV